MSAAPVTSVQLPKSTHQRLRNFAHREGYKLTALVDRWISAGLDEVESHSTRSMNKSRSGALEKGTELSPSSVVQAADEAPTSSSLGGPDARLSASVRESEKPSATVREA